MKKSDLFTFVLAAGALALALGGCSSSNPTSPTYGGGGGTGNVVTISNFAFSPTPLTVAVGTTVTWRNSDNAAHTATADNSSAFQFDTGGISPGATSAITFTQAGTFEYFCKFHTTMKGKVVVQ